MPPDSELRALNALHEQLADAFAKAQWERIGEIDGRIRACLELLAKLPQLSDEVQAARLRLKQLHNEVRIAGAEECERLRVVLLRHLEYAEGRNAYMSVDQF
ncbi:hypothetical protein [Pseudomonas sp. TTU2014-080ASC]|jgi:hypothetical protein|uniref:hypothetical protein n=1 Tax=Pseudomonas sp. TTU2014-080ASC TaxID=1729724 RepID=UPI00071862AB|nr:hypothetical protein [Pseudomonas sp. TTU2014-080ASC]KRW60910.1 hypothetical protein AO726_06085 [Pseudomonas sp. TTU2014-080ASC]